MNLPKKYLEKVVRAALQEDAASMDVTTQTLVPLGRRTQAYLVAKEPLVLCGMDLFKAAMRLRDSRIRVKSHFKEGVFLKKSAVIAEITGPARGILSGERVGLNFLQHLSGIATLTRRYVARLAGTKAVLLDTRKTTPGLRLLERYAVKTGGGQNHRMDLQSAVMVKDNHRHLLASLSEVMERLEKCPEGIPIIVEVESLEQLEEAYRLGARYIQLDNMSLAEMKWAVRTVGKKCRLEATGGITLKNIRQVAKTGVGFISVGAITHSAPAVDISLELVEK